MAFPTIPTSGAGRILFSTNTAGGATNTFPDLSGLTKNSGDLLVAIIVAYQGGSGTTDNEYSGWGGSFTEFCDRAAGTSFMSVGIAYKWSTGSETGTFTVTSAAVGATTDRQMILLSIPGAHASTPPEAGTIANGTTAAADIPSFNPTGWDVEDTLWIAVAGNGEVATTGTFDGITAAPTNYGSLFTTGNSEDIGGGCDAGVAFRQLNAASDDPASFTVDLSNARNSGLLIAVRPAASAGVDSDADGVTADSHADSNSGSFSETVQNYLLAADGHSDSPLAEFTNEAELREGGAGGEILWEGTATGDTPANRGASTGAVTWAGAASGIAAFRGASTGAVGWAGSATGAVGHRGTGLGTVGWAGTANGVTAPKGTATGTVAWAGSATGQSPGIGVEEGRGDGTITWTGTTAGITDREGASSGTITWTGAAIGSPTRKGAASGTVGWAGSSTGTSGYEGASTGTITWTGTATGGSPVIDEREGTATGATLRAGTTAAGIRTPKSAGTGTVTWTGTTLGLNPNEAAGNIGWVGIAAGITPPVFYTVESGTPVLIGVEPGGGF